LNESEKGEVLRKHSLHGENGSLALTEENTTINKLAIFRQEYVCRLATWQRDWDNSKIIGVTILWKFTLVRE